MEIETILYLLFLFGAPIFIYSLSKLRFFPVKGLGKLAGISFIILYVFIVGSAEITDHQLKKELETYDLDGDGGFSSDELTPEAEEVLNRYTQDTGRRFAPITGFVFSFVYVGFLFGFIAICNKYVFKST